MCVCVRGVCKTSMVTAKALYVAYMKSCASARIPRGKLVRYWWYQGAVISLGHSQITLCTIHDRWVVA